MIILCLNSLVQTTLAEYHQEEACTRWLVNRKVQTSSLPVNLTNSPLRMSQSIKELFVRAPYFCSPGEPQETTSLPGKEECFGPGGPATPGDQRWPDTLCMAPGALERFSGRPTGPLGALRSPSRALVQGLNKSQQNASNPADLFNRFGESDTSLVGL